MVYVQRGFAGTLQHAMLPATPEIDGLEVAARYVAGVDELEVGGDIPRRLQWRLRTDAPTGVEAGL